MALEDIFRALEEEAKERCAEIRMNAAAEVDQIDAESAQVCEELVHERLEHAKAPLEARTRRIVTDARFEHRRAVAAERERLIDSVYEAAADALKTLRTREGYAEHFSALLDEALEAARMPSSVVVDPADKELATEAIRKRGLEVKVRAELVSAGGVVVLSDNDRVKHDNTVEARLDRIRDASRTRVGELLFG